MKSVRLDGYESKSSYIYNWTLTPSHDGFEHINEDIEKSYYGLYVVVLMVSKFLAPRGITAKGMISYMESRLPIEEGHILVEGYDIRFRSVECVGDSDKDPAIDNVPYTLIGYPTQSGYVFHGEPKPFGRTEVSRDSVKA